MVAAEPKKKSFTAELDVADYGRLVQIAAAEDSSVGRLIRIAVRNYIDNYFTTQAAMGLLPEAYGPHPRYLPMKKFSDKPEEPRE